MLVFSVTITVIAIPETYYKKTTLYNAAINDDLTTLLAFRNITGWNVGGRFPGNVGFWSVHGPFLEILRVLGGKPAEEVAHNRLTRLLKLQQLINYNNITAIKRR